MIRTAILGATGYTALELIEILLRHPEAELTALTSRQEEARPVATVHPRLTGRCGLSVENLSSGEIAERADCVFSCLPHAASAESILPLLEGGCRVVDFSADFRLNSAELFEQWYGVTHVDPARLGSVPYGLPELFGDRIAGANLVANPGCYPTSANLALAPLLAGGLIEPRDIVIDSKSGVTGAGRNPKLATLFAECNESLAAYSVGQHRHTPEIAQTLGHFAGREVEVIFTPHLVPMDRGILTTAYSRLVKPLTTEQIIGHLRDYYAGKPFVRVVEALPGTKQVSGTNYCDITARVVGDRVITISCLDNLLKGASGMAVQNFNLMYGFAETMGIST